MMKTRSAIAVAAHPDDIEFMMAGTLLLFARAGYEIHVMNLADGALGSDRESAEATAARRLDEARDAARALGAIHHPPITRDLEVLYTPALLRRLTAVMRAVEPAVVLTHSPQDYMEDHMNACRLAVSAAFARGMPNLESEPPAAVSRQSVTLYHALPYGLRDALGCVVRPEYYVDIAEVLDAKRDALACHRSQKEWLDHSQGLDSYLRTMEDMAAAVGQWSGAFTHAEGWRRHSHLGFCAPDADPLLDALGGRVLISGEYRRRKEEG